jgi:uncharacterized protein YcbX
MTTTTTTMTESARETPQLTIKQIYMYPIKSIRGLALPSCPATPVGFAHDRHFMLVDVKPDPKTNLVTNMHVSKYEEMCLFTTHLPAGSSFDSGSAPTCVEVRYAKSHNFRDESKAVDAAPLEVPLEPSTEGLEVVPIRMHNSPTSGYDMGEKYNRWFSDRFGFEVKLLYLGDYRRKVLGNVAPGVAAKQARGELAKYAGLENKAEEDKVHEAAGGWFDGVVGAVSKLAGDLVGASAEREEDGIDEGISFADTAPFLIVSSTSGVDASSRVGEGMEYDIAKFRPNIVLEGARRAWEEDFWGELKIEKSDGQDITMVLTQNCARCNSLNVDWGTGHVGKGPDGSMLKLLSKDRRVDPGNKWSPIFGRYGFLTKKDQVTFSVGDKVQVARKNNDRMSFGKSCLPSLPAEVSLIQKLRQSSEREPLRNGFSSQSIGLIVSRMAWDRYLPKGQVMQSFSLISSTQSGMSNCCSLQHKWYVTVQQDRKPHHKQNTQHLMLMIESN